MDIQNWGLLAMASRVDRLTVEMSREVRSRMAIRDTMAFIEDGDFLIEFRDCGLSDEDRENLETVITVCPTSGKIVPVTKNVRDVIYTSSEDVSAVIRFVYLPPSTVLLLAAYAGTESFSMTCSEALEAERYIAHQQDYFSRMCTQ